MVAIVWRNANTSVALSCTSFCWVLLLLLLLLLLLFLLFLLLLVHVILFLVLLVRIPLLIFLLYYFYFMYLFYFFHMYPSLLHLFFLLFFSASSNSPHLPPIISISSSFSSSIPIGQGAVTSSRVHIHRPTSQRACLLGARLKASIPRTYPVGLQLVRLIGSMSPWVLPDRTQGTFRQYPGRHRPYQR